MSLSYIIDEVCEKCGYDAVDDRELLLRVINRACKEVYESTDLPGSLRECIVSVLYNSTAVLPYFIGELRNIRAHYTLERLTIREMASKYAYNPWPELWNKWRVLKKSPLQNCIESAIVPIVISMADVDVIEVNITVTGKTVNANRVSEVVTLGIGETSVSLTNLFVEIESITKDVANNQDITFTSVDTAGAPLILAVIPNDRKSSLYTLVDVSRLPYGGDLGTTYRYVDVLYKEPLPYLSVDGDEFICDGFNDAIVCKVCEYFFASQADGSAKAFEYHEKCEEIKLRRIDHTNMETEKEITFAPNGFLGMYPPSWGFRRSVLPPS
jgi:hypothetical protein